MAHTRADNRYTAHTVPAPAAERVVDLVLHLERVEDADEVVRALALAPGST